MMAALLDMMGRSVAKARNWTIDGGYLCDGGFGVEV